MRHTNNRYKSVYVNRIKASCLFGWMDGWMEGGREGGREGGTKGRTNVEKVERKKAEEDPFRGNLGYADTVAKMAV